MDLEANVNEVVARIADEFVAVRSEIAEGTPLFIQQTEPIVTGPAIWYQTDGSGNVIKKWVQTS